METSSGNSNKSLYFLFVAVYTVEVLDCTGGELLWQ
jgi:hypothetical protein